MNLLQNSAGLSRLSSWFFDHPLSLVGCCFKRPKPIFTTGCLHGLRSSQHHAPRHLPIRLLIEIELNDLSGCAKPPVSPVHRVDQSPSLRLPILPLLSRRSRPCRSAFTLTDFQLQSGKRLLLVTLSSVGHSTTAVSSASFPTFQRLQLSAEPGLFIWIFHC